MDTVERQITGAQHSQAGRWLKARGYDADLAQEVRFQCWRQNVATVGLANRIAYSTAIDMVRYLARREHLDISLIEIAHEHDMAAQMDTLARLAAIPERVRSIGEKIVAGITLSSTERKAISRFRHRDASLSGSRFQPINRLT